MHGQARSGRRHRRGANRCQKGRLNGTVHGDDSTFVGPRKDLQRMMQLMMALYQIKLRAVLGSEAHYHQEISLLSRLARWESDSIEVEAGSKHCMHFTERVSLEELSNVLTALAIKEDVGEDEGEVTKLESTGYRRVAARETLGCRPG